MLQAVKCDTVSRCLCTSLMLLSILFVCLFVFAWFAFQGVTLTDLQEAEKTIKTENKEKERSKEEEEKEARQKKAEEGVRQVAI